MRLIAFLLLALLAPIAAAEKPDPITVAPTDWPWWRGPSRDGIAAANQKPPLKWSDDENVLWKTPVPGRGHGSPTIVGDHVYLATAEPERQMQSVLCFDRKTGKQLWQSDLHRGDAAVKGNSKSSMASSTVACDGRRLIINFLHAGAIHTTALDLDGKKLWTTRVADYVLHQGFGSSPCIYQSLVLVSADNKGGGLLAGLDRGTGKIVWHQDRAKAPNYASPIVLKTAGRDQLVMTGCDLVAGFEPLTGKKLWEIKGSTTECVTSTVTDGQHIYTSGGFPRNHVSAVRADGSGKIAWENNTRVYVPSMIVRDGYLYAVLDAGMAVCWKGDTGKEVWKGRLQGAFSASLVLQGEHIYAVSESGRTFIFKASPDAFELVGENQLGDEALATPAICDSRIYIRGAVNSKGKRQEMLYCVGKKE